MRLLTRGHASRRVRAAAGSSPAFPTRPQIRHARPGRRCRRACRSARQLDDRAAMRETDRAPVPGVTALLDAGNRAGRQELEDGRRRKRPSKRQPQVQRARGRRPACGSSACTQLCRRQGEDFANRVVELPHTREAGRERDVADRHLRRFEQQPRGLRSLRARQRDRAGTNLCNELPVDVPLAVAEPARETRDSFAIDHAVSDVPHCAPDEIGPHVPFRRSGDGVGPASLACAEASLLGSGGGGQEAHVRPLRRHRRAARTAVDAGRQHSREEPSVEPRIAARQRQVAGVLSHHAYEHAPSRRQSAGGFRTLPDHVRFPLMSQAGRCDPG